MALAPGVQVSPVQARLALEVTTVGAVAGAEDALRECHVSTELSFFGRDRRSMRTDDG